jgi:hypothetical protein
MWLLLLLFKMWSWVPREPTREENELHRLLQEIVTLFLSLSLSLFIFISFSVPLFLSVSFSSFLFLFLFLIYSFLSSFITLLLSSSLSLYLILLFFREVYVQQQVLLMNFKGDWSCNRDSLNCYWKRMMNWRRWIPSELYLVLMLWNHWVLSTGNAMDP